MAEKIFDYSSYLHIDEILAQQELVSEKYGEPAHIEMLYVIVHQVYELWFKCIIHELDSVMKLFKEDYVNENDMGRAVMKLRRITKIQRLLIDQIGVLETMTPLQFLDFRRYLGTASGFQSFQFRLLENKFGVRREDRIKFAGREYFEEFRDEKREALLRSEQEASMAERLEDWLERTPFLNFEEYDFSGEYLRAVDKMLEVDVAIVRNDTSMSDEQKQARISILETNHKSYADFVDEKSHDTLQKKGLRRLSYRASIAALFINLYRDEPMLHLPFQLLHTLIEIDENFTAWRSRHALMVHRMLGRKMGTGHSSGYDYLQATVERSRVFKDLFDLSTYLIPRSEIPKLPDHVKQNLNFVFVQGSKAA